jgi:hypothetical protein
MSSDRQDHEGHLKHPTEFDELFGRAYPNPNRVGCPPRADLIALARRERPLGDPAYDHLKECSPCYLEGRAIQEADAGRRRILAWAAAAVAAVLAGTGALIFTNGGASDTQIRAQLDLRPHAIMRGEPQTDRPPLTLPRGRVSLTVLLPTGSDPGTYDVEIRDSNATPKVVAVGRAELRNRITTVDVEVPTGSLSPGAYQLAIRQRGAGWQEFPLRIE